ncbi:MAG: bifunctional glutamate N-acetyltransferase/amino-acid acetyltransferase ArgJ [Candidatus Nanopelagicales bacterium]|nr:bifunctional glutamate N-acetyltransferase/amino-acid acetyltransferase ArgJ [Candidatus Nanopelagicales bacterium]
MSVTSPIGFRAAGVAAGLKDSGDPDVAIVINDGPQLVAAGRFTSNRFQAAPVQWSREILADGSLTAVVLNSGGANACTGTEGREDTRLTAEYAARLLECDARDVAICSTGLIGVRLDLPRLLCGVDKAFSSANPDGGLAAATAIMTTDTKPKQAALSSDGYRIGGMAKGVGMLAPEMATMLVVVTTDALIDVERARQSLSRAGARSFERIDSDGCMSTNDTVLLLANGASGVEPDPELFDAQLLEVCDSLADQLIADAEGATKEIRVNVINAKSDSDAVVAARAIARSNLLKCAIHGNDPNWGRVLSALGTTSAVFDPNQVDVAINGWWVCRDGAIGDDRSQVQMTGRHVSITVDLKAGQSHGSIRTNDLTAEYVHENSAYSS